MTTRRDWNRTRFAERERAGGRCEHCGKRLPYARFCVVKNGGAFLVLCRPDTNRHFAPIRNAKLRARRHRAQLPLQEVSS